MQNSFHGSMRTPADREADLARFYRALAELERRLGGRANLGDCSGRMSWPGRGVYFFFEPGELRSDAGIGSRVVRVGTHALIRGSRSSLWGRLSQHRGQTGSGGGNHRGSIFRLLVGAAIKRRDGLEAPVSWGVKSDPGQAAKWLRISRSEVKEAEGPLERKVSDHIRAMQILWLPIEDAPGPESARGRIERNAIALLSNCATDPLDRASAAWLGLHSDREKVVRSGLWNNRHVEEPYDPAFLDHLDRLVESI